MRRGNVTNEEELKSGNETTGEWRFRNENRRFLCCRRLTAI